MKTANPLDTLREQSRQHRDQAGQTLAGHRRDEQQAEQQLSALQHYKQEYARRLQDALGRGMDAITLDNYRRFIGALDDAIERAGLSLQQHNERVAGSQQHWHRQQQRLSSFDTLAHRRATREQQHQARQEQRGSDERTNNAQARLRNPNLR